MMNRDRMVHLVSDAAARRHETRHPACVHDAARLLEALPKQEQEPAHRKPQATRRPGPCCAPAAVIPHRDLSFFLFLPLSLSLCDKVHLTLSRPESPTDVAFMIYCTSFKVSCHKGSLICSKLYRHQFNAKTLSQRTFVHRTASQRGVRSGRRLTCPICQQ